MSGNSSQVAEPSSVTEELVHLESHGVEYVTDAERDSSAKDLFFVFLGSQFSLGIIIVGSLPIVFGLGWWEAVSAITIGLAIGALLLTPISLLGVKSGVNGPVTSSAHFGSRGQIIGALINLLILTGFFTLAVWTGGEAIATGFMKMTAAPEFGNHEYAIGSAIICALVILVALVGHKAIVATEKLISYVIGISLIAIMVALLPQFDASYAGGEYLMGGFWPTWMASVAICVSMPVSYATVINDYTRYVPRNASKKVAMAVGSGMFIGCWVAFIFAAYMSTMFASADTMFVTGLFELVPTWGVLLLIFIGLVGSQPQGSLCLYGAGLTVQLLGVKHRVSATLLISVVGLAIVFAGIYLVSMIDLILAFLTLIIVCTTPWLAINCVGHFVVKKQQYDPASFFNGNQGQYWYSNGWNMPALISWGAGVFAGLMFTATDIFTGPLSDITGGISLDYLVSYLVGGGLYMMLHPKH